MNTTTPNPKFNSMGYKNIQLSNLDKWKKSASNTLADETKKMVYNAMSNNMDIIIEKLVEVHSTNPDITIDRGMACATLEYALKVAHSTGAVIPAEHEMCSAIVENFLQDYPVEDSSMLMAYFYKKAFDRLSD